MGNVVYKTKYYKIAKHKSTVHNFKQHIYISIYIIDIFKRNMVRFGVGAGDSWWPNRHPHTCFLILEFLIPVLILGQLGDSPVKPGSVG